MNDEDFMKEALALAEKASSLDEIPVGAVVVLEGDIIARAFNENRRYADPTMHAEITAIKKACEVLKNERLTGCDLFVTKEPCAMCAGAIVHARIRRLIIGAEDIKYGACGTVLDVCGNSLLNHKPEIIFGVKKDESVFLLKKFFQQKRSAGSGNG